MSNLKEHIVSYEVAVLAKEKGFVWATDLCYVAEKKFLARCLPDSGCPNNFEYELSAPTSAILQRWLREEKQIHVCPQTNYNADGPIYFCKILAFKDDAVKFYTLKDDILSEVRAFEIFKTYEGALEEGLKYTLTELL